MVDERPPLTEEQRRQRQKRLEQARRRTPKKGVEPVTADEAVPTNETDPKLDPSATPRRGRPKKPDVTAADVTGLKYFEKLAPLLERLHAVGCERDQAGNRELHYDQLCLLLLLGLFNPVVDSLRGLQQASKLETVQKRLGLGRASLGCLSEASRVFAPELLPPIIEELGAQLQLLARDRRLAEIPLTLTLVDGTLLSALPLLIQAMWLKEQTGSGLGKWRLHTHFEVDRFVPTRIELQAYCAIIACMLLCLWTGRKPTKRTYEMVCYYFLGLAAEAELLKHIEKMKPQDTT